MENCQTQLPFVSKKPIFGKIGELASLAKMPTAERESYQRSLDQYRSIAATYVYERQQGIEEGIEIGEARGIEEGIEIGEARGRDSLTKENILRMRSKGYDNKTIADLLGLDINHVNNSL